MAIQERGLGRGLDSLLGGRARPESSAEETRRLALSQLVPGTHQPRRHFDEGALSELATSIKNQGLVQPLIVRPQKGSVPPVYEIVAGERRWRAAKMAGLTEVPVIIADYSDLEAMTVAMVENLQREDLNPLEEAEGFQALKEAHGLSQEALAAKLGKSRSAVANALRILQLPEIIRQGLGEGKITAGHARALLAVTEDGARCRLYAAAVGKNLTVRECEYAADFWKKNGVFPESIEESSEQEMVRPPRRPQKSQELKDIQSRLRSAVLQGASISGTEDKGRIALPYTSKGELSFLLQLLGIVEDEDTAQDGQD